MTYEEAETLQTKYSDILYGKNTEKGYLDYWLGSASNGDNVYFVCGEPGQCMRLSLLLQTTGPAQL